MPPDNLLVRLAVLSGAEQKHVPACAGMAAILHWEPLLPPGYRIGDEGLFAGGRLVLRAGGRALAELVIGYRGNCPCRRRLPVQRGCRGPGPLGRYRESCWDYRGP